MLGPEIPDPRSGTGRHLSRKKEIYLGSFFSNFDRGCEGVGYFLSRSFINDVIIRDTLDPFISGLASSCYDLV